MRTIRIWLLAMLLAAIFVPTIGPSVWVVTSNKMLSVQTDSMAGVFSAGNVLLVKKATISKLVAGDVVSYRSPRNPNIVIAHRAVTVIFTVVTVKGDHLEPPGPKVLAHLIIGKAV